MKSKITFTHGQESDGKTLMRYDGLTTLSRAFLIETLNFALVHVSAVGDCCRWASVSSHSPRSTSILMLVGEQYLLFIIFFISYVLV